MFFFSTFDGWLEATQSLGYIGYVDDEGLVTAKGKSEFIFGEFKTSRSFGWVGYDELAVDHLRSQFAVNRLKVWEGYVVDALKECV